MIKQTYAVYGMKSEADEARLVEAITAEFPNIRVAASYACATLSVTLSEQSDEQFDQRLCRICSDLACTLVTPPTYKTLSDVESDVAPDTEKAKSGRGIPVAVFVSSICAVLVLSVLFTYTFAAQFFGGKIRDLLLAQDNDPVEGTIGETTMPYDELDLLKDLFSAYYVLDVDDEAVMDELLRAYVRATGDEYAVYYDAEELEALFSDDAGELVGIGVSVTNDTVTINGFDYHLLTVITTYKDSPAIEAGIMPGDLIYSVVDSDGETVYVHEIGQDQAINMIRGIEGSEVTLTMLRPDASGTYESITLTMERRAITTHSVEYRTCYADRSIGIVEIAEFDMTTPIQFKQAMDDLIDQGCDKFIFDLRYNGGGDLQSICAVLSTMLQEGDPMIYTVDKEGARDVDVVKEVTYTGYFANCSVSAEDIGKYRGYEFVVLTNQYTASAAELFTANLRDYDLATQVGVTTFGKGCMQTILDLSYFGVEGGLRLTTAWYLPPCEESYHGIGISPEGEEVELDPQLFEKYGNFYLIPDEHDNQLSAAIEVFNK